MEKSMSTTIASTWPPSPTPPYARPVQSPLVQELLDAGTIMLTMNITKLNSSSATALTAVLPNGNYVGQLKTIIIPNAAVATSATWNITGTFTLATTITLSQIAVAAVLEWEGAAWVLIGGNALLNP